MVMGVVPGLVKKSSPKDFLSVVVVYAFPDLPFLAFLEKARKTTQKSKQFFLHVEPLKSLEGKKPQKNKGFPCNVSAAFYAAYGFTGAFGRNLCKFTFPQRRRNLRKTFA